jgi:hypothetical protein
VRYVVEVTGDSDSQNDWLVCDMASGICYYEDEGGPYCVTTGEQWF